MRCCLKSEERNSKIGSLDHADAERLERFFSVLLSLQFQVPDTL